MIRAFATLTCSFYSKPRPGTRAASEPEVYGTLSITVLPAGANEVLRIFSGPRRCPVAYVFRLAM